jgi:hypothetical protein
MPFSEKKAEGFNLDCVLSNVLKDVTIVTCCGSVYQGTIVDDEHTRAQYGYPVVFVDKKDCDEYDKDDKDDKDDKKKPIEVDVKCDKPKFICVKLSCVPGNICCRTSATSGTTDGTQTIITPILGTSTGSPNLYQVGETVLININDIVSIGISHGCLV